MCHIEKELEKDVSRKRKRSKRGRGKEEKGRDYGAGMSKSHVSY